MAATGDLDAPEEGVGTVGAATVGPLFHDFLGLDLHLLPVHELVHSRAHLDAGLRVEAANLTRLAQVFADVPQLGHPVGKPVFAGARVGGAHGLVGWRSGEAHHLESSPHGDRHDG